jgi:hypothetical protein
VAKLVPPTHLLVMAFWVGKPTQVAVLECLVTCNKWLAKLPTAFIAVLLLTHAILNYLQHVLQTSMAMEQLL